MKYFSLGCTCCDSDKPLLRENIETGEESIMVFPTRELAAIKASELQFESGENPLVIEIDITRIRT